MAAEVSQTLEYKGGQLNVAPMLEDFQNSPDNEKDTRSSQEYLNDLEEEFHERPLLAKSKRPTKDFEAKYNKFTAKLALLSSGASSSKSSMVKNKGLVAEAYEWDEEDVSSDDNEMTEVKVPMALTNDENVVGKESVKNSEWAKISMRKHVNIEILKENQNLRKELKELTAITEAWLNSSNKVNQCINEQIPTQKKRILGVDQLTEDPSSSGQKYLVFVNIQVMTQTWLMRYFSFGGYLKELHMTWAHLEKKQTRLQTYTNITQDNVLSSWRRRHQYNVTPS
ncbi:hypothetical protein Tco_0612264 [Tanacetum coccineum]